MNVFFCPFNCNFSVPVDCINLLSAHIRAQHAKATHSIVCSQEGCCSTFSHLRTFLKHLQKFHTGSNSASATHDSAYNLHENHDSSSIHTEDTFHVVDDDMTFEDFDFKNLVEKTISWFVLQLRCKSGINECLVTSIINDVKLVLKDLHLAICMKIKQVTFSEIQTVLELINNAFDIFTLILKQFDSIYKQDNFFKKKFALIEPREIVLGTRIDQRYNSARDENISVRVTETFQYVPIKSILLQLCNQTNFRQWLDCNQSSADSKLRSVYDGALVKNDELFSNNSSIKIQLYYDDVEVANPLGSKSKIHELGMFYYTILNIPQKFTSELPNIFLLGAAYSADIKKYGFNPILRPFVQEILELESENGMKLDTNFTVRGSLTMIVADTLAAHSLLGFQSPSANYFCRLCYVHKEQINSKFKETDFIMRTPISHDILLKDKLPNRGVARASCLETLQHFSVVHNKVFDPMHDLLEGVVEKEIKLVMNYLVYSSKVITVANINNRIASFSYGIIESKNKPSSNFTDVMLKNITDSSIKQKAAQSWCLIRHFPLLFGDLFNEEDPFLDLILLLLQIMEIVFSWEVSMGQIVQLDSLIYQHHALYKELFPNVNMINKHHHMVHYPTCMQELGPMSRMSCMRYEAKHNFFKKHAHTICNFKNICKSLAFKNQLNFCCHFAKSREYSNSIEVGNGIFQETHHFPFSHILQEKINSQFVFVAKSVKVNHVLYKPKYFIWYSEENDLPKFGRIMRIVVENEVVAFILSDYVTCHFDERFRAYAILPTSTVTWKCVFHHDLHHVFAYNLKKPYNYSGNMHYITLHH